MQTTPTVAPTPPMPTIRPPVQEPRAPDLEQQSRKRAAKRSGDKIVFTIHLVAYLVITAVLVVTWAVTEPGYFFWPILVILAWGVEVAIHGYSAYGGKMTEA